MYHYSTKTGKPEFCRATSRELCPYGDCPHSISLSVIQQYADNENELLSKLSREQFNLFTQDLMNFTGERPYILSSVSEDAGLKITEDTYKYLGIKEDTRVWLTNFERIFIVPTNPRFVQSFLQNGDGLNLCYKTLRDDFNNKRLGVTGGQSYDKWDALPYLDYARANRGVSVLDREIRRMDPHKNSKYTLTSMWADFLSSDHQDLRILHCTKNKNKFYIIAGNTEYTKEPS